MLRPNIFWTLSALAYVAEAGIKGRAWLDHNFIGRNYIGHNYIAHNYIAHNYTGHNYIATI